MQGSVKCVQTISRFQQRGQSVISVAQLAHDILSGELYSQRR